VEVRGRKRRAELTPYKCDYCGICDLWRAPTLYTYLDMLQQRALYCDMDSVLYVQPRDESALVETGDILGAMTSELKPSKIIDE